MKLFQSNLKINIILKVCLILSFLFNNLLAISQIRKIHFPENSVFFNNSKYDSAFLEYQNWTKEQPENYLKRLKKKELLYIANLHFQNAYYSEAIDFYSRALNVKRENRDRKLPLNLQCLLGLANANLAIGNLDETSAIIQEVLSVAIPKDSLRKISYFNFLYLQGCVYYEIGNIDTAEIIFKKIDIQLNRYGLCENKLFYQNQYQCSRIYMKRGDYETSLSIISDVIKGFKNDFGTLNFELIEFYILNGYLLQLKGNFPKAMEIYNNAKYLLSAISSESHPLYGKILSYQGYLFKTMYLFNEAAPLLKESVNNCISNFGERNSECLYRLNRLSALYKDVGKYDEAIRELRRTIVIAKSLKGSPNISLYMNNLAGIYKQMNQYDSAIAIYRIVLKETINKKGRNHPLYGNYSNNLALAYSNAKNYDSSLFYFKESIRNGIKNYPPDHFKFGIRYSNIGNLYHVTGIQDSAIHYYKRSLTNALSNFNPSNIIVARRNFKIANCFRFIEEPDSALLYYERAKNSLYENLKLIFTAYNENDREKFFMQKTNPYFDGIKSFYHDNISKKSELAKNFYNDELIQKGILLQATTSMQNSILNSGDFKLIEKYKSLKSYQEEYIRLLNLPGRNYSNRIDSIKNIIESLELYVTSNASRIEGFQGFFSTVISWEIIRNRLNENEAAIEFSVVKYSNIFKTDSVFYYALIIRKDSPIPQAVFLFEEQELQKIISQNKNKSISFVNSLYGTRGVNLLNNSIHNKQSISKLYQLIWEPIDSALQGIKKVYFAPSGILNSISFSAITTPNGDFLFDVYQLIPLTSTRNIPDLKSEIFFKPDKNILFGGIDYDAKSIGDYPVKNNSFHSNNILTLRSTIHDSAMIYWNYLPGTLQEVNEISIQLTSNDFEAFAITDNQASEEYFKSLQGRTSPTIIHFATHGFFFPFYKNHSATNKNKDESDEEEKYNAMDNPLQRSGLLMAGANNAWRGEPLTNKMEDGVLTSWEISNTWLGGTKLVVLSACETGLGEIKGGEGVFGLQRAFKLAGVNYIMMSLWQVPDKETAEFMQRFYTHWINRNTIRQAFDKTQKEMKIKYDPFFWAAFVLTE